MKNSGNIALLIALFLLSVFVYEQYNGTNIKVGVIQYNDLIYKYQGMVDATKKYTEKMDTWSNQMELMESDLNKLVEEIKIDSINRDKKKFEKDYQTFLLKRKSYFTYKQKGEQIAAEEDKKMTIGVINQMNDHIKAFAEQEGYGVIISNMQEQNVGYVNQLVDVTEKLLEFANKKYGDVE